MQKLLWVINYDLNCGGVDLDLLSVIESLCCFAATTGYVVFQ